MSGVLLSESQVQTLREALAVAAATPELIGQIDGLYADVERAIQLRKPRCDISGKCCQFEKFGHLLFVTTAELAVFGLKRQSYSPFLAGGVRGGVLGHDKATLHATPPTLPSPAGGEGEDGALATAGVEGCPFQIAGKCSVHTIRPFGCRIYFCDPSAEAWQQDQYENFHMRLRQLHDTLSIPYLYVEWRQGLRAIAHG